MKFGSMTQLVLGAVVAFAAPGYAETVAVLQGLDKTTARIATIRAPVGQSVRFGTLVITARACFNHRPDETPESAAFLQIGELPPDAGPDAKAEAIFSGWMFASSPALSALENPVYDVSVLDCKDTSASPPETTQNATTAPEKGKLQAVKP